MIKPIVLAIFILLAGLIIIFQTSRIAGAFLFETNEFTLYDENDNIVDCKFFRFLFLSTKALNFNIDIELLSTPLSNSENIFAEIKPGENLEHLGESLIIKKSKISSNSN